MNRWPYRVVSILLCCLCLGFGGAKVSSERELGPAPAARPQMVYVADFDLEAEDIQSGRGPLRSQRQHRGPVGTILQKPAGAPRDPAEEARELVDLMATSLVKELTKRGINARRLGDGEALPSDGLLVRGVFTRVDEGNRLRRAAIGFGAGETETQVIVSVDDLTQGAPRPFYELDTSAESRKLPGAVITLNPYVAAAKFVLAGRDLNKGVTQTASKIADNIAGRLPKQTAPSN